MSDADDDRRQAVRRAAERLVRRGTGPVAPDRSIPCWDASFFGLQRVARFAEASVSAQQAVLVRCADGVLAESWFIEQGGVRFCARMTLAAEHAEQERLYALIGADEAAHAMWLQPWVDLGSPQVSAFNRFTADLAENGTPQTLAYLLQVVLEGFGIVHYHGLGAACRVPALAATLTRMAQDEALHYAGGVASFRAEQLTAAERAFLVDASAIFLQMMRSGPQHVVATLDHEIELGGRADVAAVFEALESAAGAPAKLARLRRLMARPGMSWLLDRLDEQGLFEACGPADCAQIYVGSR